ncbi:abortyltetrahydrofolate-dependent phosphoribosylg lycinamide formyltransferase [Novosphingobium sp. PY1]|nr:abortyltetrahydrofolate-dependent phosphoribosylg lycinamide formyltransferase [Novosphingobium sp. PY1]
MDMHPRRDLQAVLQQVGADFAVEPVEHLARGKGGKRTHAQAQRLAIADDKTIFAGFTRTGMSPRLDEQGRFP